MRRAPAAPRPRPSEARPSAAGRMPPSPPPAAAGTTRQRFYATSLMVPRPLKPRHHTASADFGEIAVDEAFLRAFHLAPIDALGARIVAVRQEFALYSLRQFDRPRRAQISVGPDRLALVGQEIVHPLLRLLLVGRILHETHDIGKHHSAF